MVAPGQTRCPECGSLTDPQSVVRGERLRNKTLAWIGAAVGLLGVALFAVFAVVIVLAIDWNPHKALGWLLNDLDSRDAWVRQAAWNEIARRRGANRLSELEQDLVVGKGLQLQTSSANSVELTGILNFIAERYVARKLTPSQADRFFARAMQISLAVRPLVGALSQVPYTLTATGRGPSNGWMHVRVLGFAIEGEAPRDFRADTEGTFGSWLNEDLLPPTGGVGRRQLRLRVELTGTANRYLGDTTDMQVARRIVRELSADITVVPGVTPIETTEAPDASAMAACFKGALSFSPQPLGVLSGRLFAEAVLADTAFEVFIRSGGKEYHATHVCGAAGSSFGSTFFVDGFHEANLIEADMILRSSEELARSSMNLTRMWKGELVLRNIPILK